ncbi:MAG: type II toxin-antitoxin system RelE/ParE family toxin [Armatimonadetes bacterium]|nr:type II toxin-antitoxin system RelE/ParE family toxin [Armatimonadota bacterium]
MKFVETAVFTKRVVEILSDEQYRRLQEALVVRPDLGKVIPGSGGLRKLRWSTSYSGKRGGVRVIYFWAVQQDTILMLFIFRKNEKDDLTPEQIQALRRIVEAEYP